MMLIFQIIFSIFYIVLPIVLMTNHINDLFELVLYFGILFIGITAFPYNQYEKVIDKKEINISQFHNGENIEYHKITYEPKDRNVPIYSEKITNISKINKLLNSEFSLTKITYVDFIFNDTIEYSYDLYFVD